MEKKALQKTAVCSVDPFRFSLIPDEGHETYRLSRKNKENRKSRCVGIISVVSGRHIIIIPPKFEEDCNIKLAAFEAISFLNGNIGTP